VRHCDLFLTPKQGTDAGLLPFPDATGGDDAQAQRELGDLGNVSITHQRLAFEAERSHAKAMSRCCVWSRRLQRCCARLAKDMYRA